MKKLLLFMLAIILIASCRKEESELILTPEKQNQPSVITVFQTVDNQILINWNTYMCGNTLIKDTATFKHVDFSVLDAEQIEEIEVLNTDKYGNTDTLKIFSISTDTLIYKNKDYVKAAVRCENLLYKNAPYLLKIIVTDNNKITTENQTIINYQF